MRCANCNSNHIAYHGDGADGDWYCYRCYRARLARKSPRVQAAQRKYLEEHGGDSTIYPFAAEVCAEAVEKEIKGQ